MLFCLFFALCFVKFVPRGVRSNELNKSQAIIFAMDAKDKTFAETSAILS